MTKPITIAALFFAAASVAATASLVNEYTAPAQEAVSAGTSDGSARRGTRSPLTAVADAETSIGDQPRRGERSTYELAGSPSAELTADGIRRGTR